MGDKMKMRKIRLKPPPPTWRSSGNCNLHGWSRGDAPPPLRWVVVWNGWPYGVAYSPVGETVIGFTQWLRRDEVCPRSKYRWRDRNYWYQSSNLRWCCVCQRPIKRGRHTQYYLDIPGDRTDWHAYNRRQICFSCGNTLNAAIRRLSECEAILNQ